VLNNFLFFILYFHRNWVAMKISGNSVLKNGCFEK